MIQKYIIIWNKHHFDIWLEDQGYEPSNWEIFNMVKWFQDNTLWPSVVESCPCYSLDTI